MRQIAELAVQRALPSMWGLSEYAEAGGLMVYSANLLDLERRAATFVSGAGSPGTVRVANGQDARRRTESMKKLLIFAAVIAVVGSASAQDAMQVIRVTPDALAWKDNPNIPPGAQVAVMQGDPTKAFVTPLD